MPSLKTDLFRNTLKMSYTDILPFKIFLGKTFKLTSNSSIWF